MQSGDSDHDSASVHVDCAADSIAFPHFFSGLGYNNTDFTYTPQYRRQYSYLSSHRTGPVYVRMHNILTSHGKGDYYFREGDDYNGRGEGAVFSLVDGTPEIDWTDIDKVYDKLVAHDMRPIVELERMPPDLRDSEKSYPAPTDYELWEAYIEEFVRHVRERYGHDEVSTWYFETWNEPDNYGDWGPDEGDYSDLFRYWDHSVSAVKRVSEEYRVGGPGTKQMEESFELFDAFLEHCVEGTNYATGETGTPLDFVSVHCKGVRPKNEDQYPRTEKVFDDVRRYLDILDTYPLDDVEFFNDESDVAWSGNKNTDDFDWLNFRNTRYFPGFNCKLVDYYCRVVEDEYGYDMSRMIADNCHLHWEPSFFSGNRSRLTPVLHYPTRDVVKKPVFNSHHLLELLGDRRVRPADEPDDGRVGALPTLSENVVSVLVWHFDDDVSAEGVRSVTLSLDNVPLDDPVYAVEYRIDDDYSNAYGAWQRAGGTRPPSRETVAAVRRQQHLWRTGSPEQVELDGTLETTVDLPMHSVSLFLYHEKTSLPVPEDPDATAHAEVDTFGEPTAFLDWKPVDSRFLSHYRIRRTGPHGTRTMGEDRRLTAATFVDMDLDWGAEYHYEIEAVGLDGATVPIDTARATTTRDSLEF